MNIHTEQSNEYWNSLSGRHKHIIMWWERYHGMNQACERNRAVQQFASKHGHHQLKAAEQHEFAYDNFKTFTAEYAPTK
jgi:hypothetical protein